MGSDGTTRGSGERGRWITHRHGGRLIDPLGRGAPGGRGRADLLRLGRACLAEDQRARALRPKAPAGRAHARTWDAARGPRRTHGPLRRDARSPCCPQPPSSCLCCCWVKRSFFYFSAELLQNDARSNAVGLAGDVHGRASLRAMRSKACRDELFRMDRRPRRAGRARVRPASDRRRLSTRSFVTRGDDA